MLLTKKQLQQQQKQQYHQQNLLKEDLKTRNKQIYDHQKQQTVVATSLIVDSVQLPTKHSPQKIKQNLDTPKKYQQIQHFIESIRKYVFIYTHKLSSFLQYLIKYSLILIQLYQQYKYTPKPSKQQNQDPLITNKELVKQSKECLTRISCLLYKMLYPKFQLMSDSDGEIVNNLAQTHPEIFYEQNTNNIDDLQYVISFISFDISYMGKPCLLYLIKDYLIIIQDLNQIRTMKKKQIINKLAIIHLDYTTKIQIYEDKMLYQPLLLYISGGQKSNSIFLEFKGKKLNAEEQRKFKQHLEEQYNKKKYVCSHEQLQKWQIKTAKSNMEILKSIIQLKISYYIFNYNCQALKIRTNYQVNCEIERSSAEEKGTNMKIIKPLKLKENFKINGAQVVYPQEKCIPNGTKVYLEILGVEWRHFYLKYYIIRLSVLEYLNNPMNGYFKQSRAMKGKQHLHEQINYNKISQIVYIQEKELLEIQRFIFQIYEKYQMENEKQRQKKLGIYHTFIRFNQYKQNYINNYLTQISRNDIQCMGIMDLFNTFFKSKLFYQQSQIFLDKFKVSQGFWNIIAKQEKQQYSKIYCSYHFNKKNKCYQCLLESQDGLGTINQIQRYWKFYSLSLSYPYEQSNSISTSLNSRLRNNRKQPFCHLFACNLESNYINSLHKIYGIPTINRNLYQQPKDRYKQLKKQIIDHFNKISYIKYLSQNTHNISISNGLKYNLLRSVLKTTKIRAINVLIYKLPQITQQEIKIKNNCYPINHNKTQDLVVIDQDTGSDLDIQHQGLFCKSVGNIYKDTTIKHLKFIIGQQLGLCNQYIGHFMETFALTLMVMQERKDENNWLFNTFNTIFNGKTKRKNIQYVVKQLYVFHDFQRVHDILNNLSTLLNSENYFVGLKKLIKVEEIPLVINDLKGQNEKQSNKIINCYYQLLELQIAEMWYKLNEGEILIEEKQKQFVKRYFSYLYTYYRIKLSNKQQQKQKNKQIIWYKILIEKGILSKKLLKYYYKLQNKQIKQQLAKQIQLLNLFKNQYQQCRNKYLIINKLIKLIYSNTSWNIFIQNIQLLKNPQKQQYFPDYYILINDTGLLLLENNQKFSIRSKTQDLYMLPTLQNVNKNSSITLLNYHDIDVEMFGSVICLNRYDRIKQKNIGKMCINSFRSYKIYELIKFYQKWNLINDPQVEKQIKFNFSMQQNSKMKVRKQNQKCKSMKFNYNQNQIQLFFSQYFKLKKSQQIQLTSFQQ